MAIYDETIVDTITPSDVMAGDSASVIRDTLIPVHILCYNGIHYGNIVSVLGIVDSVAIWLNGPDGASIPINNVAVAAQIVYQLPLSDFLSIHDSVTDDWAESDCVIE